MMFSRAFVGFCLLCATLGTAFGADWTRFRGPNGVAVSYEKGLPVTWSSSQNIVWKSKLPGLGSSSPIVLGNRIYLTCYTGYAESKEEPGDQENLMRHVVCIDRATGEIVWKKDFTPALPESNYSGGNNSWHGFSTSTMTTDGERLYVFFGKSGVYCLDMDGKELWHADVGSKTAGWGSGNSPVLYKDLLIVNASIESQTVFALDKLSGKEIWKIGGLKGARNTPVLVEAADGNTELVINVPGSPIGYMQGYNPSNGEELWRCEAIPDRGYVVPSMVVHDDIIYAIGGRKNTAVAVKAGGKGDVTKTHQLWSQGFGSNVSSPVFYNGYQFWVHERRGTAYCLNGKTGELEYQERLDPRPGIVYSSGIAADGKLYFVSQHNGTFVLEAKPEFKLMSHNVFADDDSRTNVGLVVSNGQLLMRNDTHLYCIGKK
jgi:hypothetical protein